ncbi:MAG: hypothetical protein WC055_00840 [Melioribacteraceae bacterium]
MKKFKRYIDMAIEIASKNNQKFRLGAIAIDKHGTVLSTGQNSSKTHTAMSKLANKHGHKDQIKLHAELSAILKSRGKIHSLIVVRLLRNGKIANAKPCPICSAAISFSGIKNVVFSNEFNSYTLEKRNN